MSGRPNLARALMAAGLLLPTAVVAPVAHAVPVNISTPGIYIQQIDSFGSPVTGAPALQVLVGDATVLGKRGLTATSVAEFTAGTTSASPAMTQAVNDFFANGGQQLTVVGAASADAADLIDALEGLEVPGALDIIVPELRGLGDGDWQDVATSLIDTAVSRDAMAWIDPPEDAVGHGATPTFADPGGVAALGRQLRDVVGEGAQQAVLLSGGVIDSTGNARAASPGVLGLRAATDVNDGIWDTMNPLPGLAGVLPEDSVPLAGVGPLRFAGVTALFRFDDAYTTSEIPVTLATAGEVHYASARRMLLWVRQSIEDAMVPYVFEPNDMNTWSAMTAMIASFLTDVWQEGGLDGVTPAEAYAAQCSATPEMMLTGYLQCDVRIDLVTGTWQILSLVQEQAQAG